MPLTAPVLRDPGRHSAGAFRACPLPAEELRHGLHFQRLQQEGDDVHLHPHDDAGPRQGVAQLRRHQVHRGGPVTQLAENHEDHHRRPGGIL